MTGRRNPFREIEEMMNRMSHQFEESIGDSQLGELTGGAGAAVDVADRDGELVVTADLPGFQREQIGLTLRGDELRISAEREQESEESDDEDGHYLRKERRHQSVSRSVTLPEEVDEDGVTAQFQNGVLTVTLPKRRDEGDDSHRIDIS